MLATVVSHSGNLISGNTANSIGVLKFYIEGTKMDTANGYGGNFVELMNFDSKSGVLSNARILNAQVSPFTIYCGTYGAEFSPDSHLLYITSFMANQGFVLRSWARIKKFMLLHGTAINLRLSVIRTIMAQPATWLTNH